MKKLKKNKKVFVLCGHGIKDDIVSARIVDSKNFKGLYGYVLVKFGDGRTERAYGDEFFFTFRAAQRNAEERFEERERLMDEAREEQMQAYYDDVMEQLPSLLPYLEGEIADV